jgi:hypothetical protein
MENLMRIYVFSGTSSLWLSLRPLLLFEQVLLKPMLWLLHRGNSISSHWCASRGEKERKRRIPGSRPALQSQHELWHKTVNILHMCTFAICTYIRAWCICRYQSMGSYVVRSSCFSILYIYNLFTLSAISISVCSHPHHKLMFDIYSLNTTNNLYGLFSLQCNVLNIEV